MALRAKRGTGGAPTQQPRQRHTCWFCQRQFQKKEHLIRHERTHTAERPFECQNCGRSYARRDTLQRHMRLHQGDADEKDSTMSEGNSQQTIRGVSPASQTQQPVEAVATGFSSTAQIEGISNPSAPGRPPDQGASVCAVENLSNNPLLPNWFSGTENFELPETFDLGAFNLDFADFSTSWLTQDPMFTNPELDRMPGQSAKAEEPDARHEQLRDRSSVWFSFYETPLNLDKVPSILRTHASASHEVDEEYRTVVERQLNRPSITDAVPSTAFLNRCIRLYIEKFSRLLPIIHLPSFHPTEQNAWLILSMCSVGSQMIGTAEAAAYGQRIFDNVQRAVLASWQALITGSFNSLAVLQAVVLGATFAILSSNPAHLLTSQAFHGTLCFCYQKVLSKLKRLGQSARGDPRHFRDSVENVETLRFHFARIGCVLRIHDAEHALLTHATPAIHPNNHDKFLYQPDDEFRVPDLQSMRTAQNQWQVPGLAPTSDPSSSNDGVKLKLPTLWDYANLSDLLSEVGHRRFRCIVKDEGRFHDIEQSLNVWYQEQSSRLDLTSSLRLDCLYHSAWLAILCDVNQLEIVFGREGSFDAQEMQAQIRQWASSPRARRAVVHAYLIRRALETVTLAEWPALHVPRCGYQAGLVLYSVAKFSTGPTATDSRSTLQGFQDIRTLMDGGSLSSSDWWRLDHEYTESGKLEESSHVIVSLLRRIGPWGLSLNLANTLEAILTSH